MPSQRKSFETVRAESQRCLVDFLNAELAIGHTFVENATSQTESGHHEHSAHSKGEADKAMFTINHFLNRVEDPGAKAAIADGSAELRQAIADLSIKKKSDAI